MKARRLTATGAAKQTSAVARSAAVNTPDLNQLRTRILETMTAVSNSAPGPATRRRKPDLKREWQQLKSQLKEHRALFRTEDQLVWQKLAEQECEASLAAFAAGDLARGVFQIQQAEAHFRRSFSPKKIRPDFLVGMDGRAQKV